MTRRFGIAVLLVAAIAVVAAARFAGPWLHEAAPGDGTVATFAVRPGEPFGSMAARLESEKLIVSALRLRILARLSDGADRRVRAGTYELVRGTPPDSLLAQFVEGRVRLLRFVVPEGHRIDQIAALAEAALGFPAASFREAASDSALRARLECPVSSVEGYLFPETYFFPDGVDAVAVVVALTERFEDTWVGLRGDPPAGMNRHDVVTLASIVEAETGVPEERPRVAAVYLNRLREGWKLEADPTVRYGLGQFSGRLYYKHLDIETPYNTYRVAGLPPGPIGSPGRHALQAVLEPLEPCDDFFFVASGDGGHVFSPTKTAHDRAVAEYRRRLR